MTSPPEIRPGLISSINAAYLREEIEAMLRETDLRDAQVRQNLIGLVITGVKSR
jgi:hypothetical protein